MYKKNSQNWTKHTDFIIIDTLCLHIALVLAYILRHGIGNPYMDLAYRKISGVLTITSLIVCMAFGSMNNIWKRNAREEFFATLKHVCLVEVITTFYLFSVKEGITYSRIVLYLLPVLYCILSFIFRQLRKKHERSAKKNSSSLMIICTKETIKSCLAELESSQMPYSVNAIAVLGSDTIDEEINDIPILTDESSAIDYACRNWVDEVLISVPQDFKYEKDLIGKFFEMGIVVHFDLSHIIGVNVKKQFVEQIGEMNVITTGLNFATPTQLFLKRLIDIIGGFVGCVITLILFVFIAPVIYIKSPGPIFFTQERVGKNGKKFKMYKFRSMYMDAEERKAELMKQNRVKDGMMFKLDWDPRIIGSKVLPDGTTKKGIGNYIRDLSLDEFPQFFNVFKGDMSLVGTRPPTIDEWEKYELHHRARLSIKPGITGMWQVSGRSNITDFEEVVRLDTKYISEWNLLLDIKILFKTVAVVIKKDGSM